MRVLRADCKKTVRAGLQFSNTKHAQGSGLLKVCHSEGSSSKHYRTIFLSLAMAFVTLFSVSGLLPGC